MKFIWIAGLLGLSLSQKTPPVLPKKYELQFVETAKLGPISGQTKGKMYVDEDNNRELIQREDGRADRYCGSVFKLSHTKCNHYVVNNKRYLDFPDKKYCCFCCDSSHGCGIVKSDWLVTSNATFVGNQTLPGDIIPSAKWNIKGLQDNLYWHKNDELKTPRRLFQVSDDDMNFTSFYIGIIDPNVFNLPSYCTDKCGATTVCAGLRGEQQQLTIQKQ